MIDISSEHKIIIWPSRKPSFTLYCVMHETTQPPYASYENRSGLLSLHGYVSPLRHLLSHEPSLQQLQLSHTIEKQVCRMILQSSLKNTKEYLNYQIFKNFEKFHAFPKFSEIIGINSSLPVF